MATPEVVSAPIAQVLRAQGFSKRYRSTVAVDALDLEIRRGEVFGLIGPDGAGKSSLMKAAAGVLSFEAGTLEVFGVSLDSERACEQVKGRLGLMPQGLGQNLYADLSIEENVDFFGQLRLVPKAELEQRKNELLAATRLDAFRDRPMKQLSGGMKQKLGLVCTLIHAPDLIILDEPTTGVDPVSRRDFWAILARLLQSRGITALVSTAYMDEASRFDRIGLMFGGKLLAADTPEAIGRLAPGSLVNAPLDSASAMATLGQLRQTFAQADVLGTTLHVFVDDADAEQAVQQVSKAAPGLPREQLRAKVPTLEDTFIALLRKRGLVQLQRSGEGSVLGNSSTSGNSAMAAAANDAGAAIEARALTRIFGDFHAAEAVSFRVPQGEIFGLLGANGAGKSTVIKMLTGILQPTRGEGWVAGADMRIAGFEIKERIGYMSQAFSLYLDLTVAENIRLYAGIYGLDKAATEQRLGWVLDMADLGKQRDARAASLPMGQRQRLALGCALVHRPRVLFLDEPTSGVDPIGRRSFWEMLYRLSREERVAILVTTHYMSEAEHCDHLALMYAGRVVADDSPAGMKATVEQEAGHLLEITAPQPQAALDVLAQAGFAHGSLFGKLLHVLSSDPVHDIDRIATLLAGVGQRDVKVEPQPLSMEDVFVYRVTALEAAQQAARQSPQREAA
ncbi:MAG: ATP-binding cassette domain-containing protein [Burkholderiales bacterium]|nr:ATP-binding cassette domain-containing protein [Burkholderiales bacterium]